MDLFLAICQGLGLALAVGIGGPLAALFIAMMAALDAGIHPDGTDYDVLRRGLVCWSTLLAVIVVFMSSARPRRRCAVPMTAVAAPRSARSSFAASLAEEGEPAWLGLVVGAVAAALAAAVSFVDPRRARSGAPRAASRRREADAANL